MAQIIHRKKRRIELFLAELRKGRSIASSAAAAGIARRTVYNWREADEEFARQWDEAIEEGIDRLEDVAMQRAVAGSDTLAIFLLKANRPDKYRDTQRLSFDSQSQLKVTFKITGDADG